MVWLWILCIWLALGPVGNVAQQHQQQQEEQVVEQVVEVEEELPSCADFQECVPGQFTANLPYGPLPAFRTNHCQPPIQIHCQPPRQSTADLP